MNYNGFKLGVASTMAAMMWAGTLSAFFFPQPRRAAGLPVGEAMFPTRSGDCSHDGRTPFIGSR